MKLIRFPALIALSLFVALPARTQTPPNQLTPDAADAVSLEPVIFEIVPITGTLKESVQKGQQLVWLGRQGANDRRISGCQYFRRVPAQ